MPEPPTKPAKKPLRVILNGLGKDAAYIISRINGFTYVETEYDFYHRRAESCPRSSPSPKASRAAVRCYGANDVLEGVAIMKHEKVDVSITGNSTNPTRFQHLVAGTYKKWADRKRQKILLCCFWRRHRPYPASGQHGCRPRFLRLDRLHGPYAWRRAVCRFFLRTCSRGNDGPDRYGQQPHGWRYRCLRGCSRRSVEIIFLSVKKEDGFSVLFLFCPKTVGEKSFHRAFSVGC